ncbi:MAG: hypothetical protein UD936_00765 [Acutalibacteraceae bacterium]|nr:hypothetical protein [Acutalibacteraceae bacterium]
MCFCFARVITSKTKRIFNNDSVIKAVKSVYPEYNWCKEGIIDGRRKSR